MNILGTVLFGAATNVWVLVASRAAQGLGSSVVWSAGLAMISDSISPDEAGHWMGWVVSAANVAVVIAPVFGGLVYARAGYYSVFLMCVGLLTVDIFLRAILIERKTAEAYLGPSLSKSQGPPGSPRAYQGDDTSEAPDRHDEVNRQTHDNPTSQQRHAVDPERASSRRRKPSLLLLRLITNRRFASAFYGFAIFATILAGFDGVLALYVKNHYQWDPINAGIIYLTLGIPGLAGPLVGALGDRIGPKWLATGGIGSTAVFLTLLAFTTEPLLDRPVVLVLVLTAIGTSTWQPEIMLHKLTKHSQGTSLVFFATPVAAEMSAVVDQLQKDEPRIGPGYAQAYGLLNCANAVGCLVGPVFNGALIDRYGWRVMNLALAILTVCGLPLTVRLSNSSVHCAEKLTRATDTFHWWIVTQTEELRRKSRLKFHVRTPRNRERHDLREIRDCLKSFSARGLQVS